MLTFYPQSYGTLLGTSIYQSFVNGIVSYRALPRPQFSTLQAALTPVYFAIQTALPIVMLLTYPGTKNLSPLGGANGSNSLSGVLEPSNRWNVLVPIASVFVMNGLNLLWAGPVTTRIMKERKHQGECLRSSGEQWVDANIAGGTETRDGKKYYDDGPHSKEMARLNKAFSRMHGISAMVNLVGLGITVWYGFLLAERLQ